MMNFEDDRFTRYVRNRLGNLAEKVIIVDWPDPIQFEDLHRAIVFLNAIWSGPSLKAMQEYTAIYDKLVDLRHSDVAFYILNIDKLSNKFLEALPGQLGGNGETFMIKNGRIVCTISYYSKTFEQECLKSFLAAEGTDDVKIP